MSVHQCASFYNNLRLLRKPSVRQIAKYLSSTSIYVDLPYGNLWLTTIRVVYRPDIEKGIYCFVDGRFSSGWAQADSKNAENFMYRTVCVIT